MTEKIDIQGLTLPELKKWFASRGIPEYRGEQVFNWLYKNNVTSFSGMGNLPEAVITSLKKNFKFAGLISKKRQVSEDGSIKYLWALNDGLRIESVYLPYEHSGRNSVCISSQVGCKLGCKFCVTGKHGWQRNLTTGEIVDQVIKIINDRTVDNKGNDSFTGLSNIVFMGMGEPLLNIKPVLQAVKIFNEPGGLNIGQRKITISTAGIVPGIKKLAAQNNQLGLAVSLNAPDDKLRNKIMPVNKRYPLSILMEAIKDYINLTNRRVTFEYVLLKNVNDGQKQAEQLASLLENILCHVNLIRVNTSSQLPYVPPSARKTKEFMHKLKEKGINVTLRQSKGDDIEAACGQLKGSR